MVESIKNEVSSAMRCMQISGTLTQGQREEFFLRAFPKMQALIALEPSIVQSHLNKIAHRIHAAEQAMGVRYETCEDIYLACENANEKIIADGLASRGAAPRGTAHVRH